MTTRPALTLLCLLAPLLAGADTLDVYGNLIGKTVLMPSALPVLADSMISDLPDDKTKAIARIENALSEKGLEVLQDGPHFVRVFRREARGFLTNAPLRGAELAAPPGQAATPTGNFSITGADLPQVLAIYAQLRQRTILRPAVLPGPPVRLQSQGALTREEGAYAVATVLALNGVCVLDDGAKFVQVVPWYQKPYVRTRAPQPEPGAKLFDPEKVPSMGLPNSSGPLTETERIERELERLRKAFYDLMHLPDPRKHPAKRLLEFYAGLSGKRAVPSKNVDGTHVWFHVETPLAKGELLYAIETTFALNSLAIIPVDDHRIRLGNEGKALKNTRKRIEPGQPKREGVLGRQKVQ